MLRAALIRTEADFAMDRHIAFLCEGLRAEGHEATMVDATISQRFGVQIRALFRQLGDIAPHLVHLFQVSSVSPSAALAARRCRAERLVTCFGNPKRRPWWRRWLDRSTHWIVPTEELAARHVAAGWPEDRVLTFAPGIRQSPEGSPAGLKPGPDQRPILVSFGRWSLLDGARDAIWACDILRFLYPTLRLILVGDGPDRAALMKFARDIHVADHVTFISNGEQAASWLLAADVVWVPDRRQGFPLAALEAMAAGKPVVVSDSATATTGINPAARCLVFPAGDKPALARQTRTLLEQPSLRTSLTAAARDYVAKHFSCSAMVAAHIKLYERLWESLNRNKRAAG
jgi:glycosyltransferase involved in cell wall biosynthesis